jgi:flagellar protein FliO/FliZ
LGGEKLKTARRPLGVFFALILFAANLSIFSIPLSGQERPEGQRQFMDESAIILEDPAVIPAAQNTSSVFVLLRMVLVLALAALAIYGVVFFIKMLARPQESRDPHLKLLARLPLGADSFAAVISVGARAWLVGCSSGGVNLISEIDDTESLETMLLDDANRAAEEEARRVFNFRALLDKSFINKQGKSSPGGTGSAAERLRKQRERLG